MKAILAPISLAICLVLHGTASALALPLSSLPGTIATPISQTVDPCYRRCVQNAVWGQAKKWQCFHVCKRIRR